MNEYSTLAIVLGQENLNDADSLIDFYTKDFGRLKVRAISLKKITSKLAAHLEPLTFSNIRLIEKKNLIVVDALTIDRFDALRRSSESFCRALELLAFFKENIFEGEPDLGLWHWLKDSLFQNSISYELLIKRLGLSR